MPTKEKNVKNFEEFVSENIWVQPSFSDIAAGVATNLTQSAIGKVKDFLSLDKKPVKSSIDASGLIASDKIEKHITQPEAFKEKLISICQSLQINPNWLLLVMVKESDLNPKARNPMGSASGLIQFTSDTARSLGTSIGAIRSMDGVEQLTYVYKYYAPYAGKMTCVEDVYLVTFMPGHFASRNDNSKVMGGSKIAGLNGVVDLNHDGQIKMGEFKEYVTKNIPDEYRKAVTKIG